MTSLTMTSVVDFDDGFGVLLENIEKIIQNIFEMNRNY
jgi:2-methylisocitrate lyase-like PEP mutase family enzyme